MLSVWNDRSERSDYSDVEREIVSLAASASAQRVISRWPGFAPTPLVALDAAARRLGVGAVHYKDEAGRLGQGSFKILGGAYAADLALADQAAGPRPTLCCATDGNHGRSVAFAARRQGVACVVYMHKNAPPHKAQAIAALGARVVTVAGTYDDSVQMASEAAARNGWLLVADTSDDPADPTTRRVMQGYGVMMLELFEQLEGDRRPTHVFIQGGVGGLAAGVAGLLAERYGAARPTVVVVEPEAAACLLESARQRRPASVGGDLITAMGMLSTGKASPVAWPILEMRADLFIAIADDAALAARDELAAAPPEGPGLDVGVSGAAGLAGLMAVAADRELRSALRLDAGAQVLLFGTESAA